jgi:signal peptidase I
MNDEQLTKPESGNDQGGFSRELFLFIWETFKVVVISLAIILPIRYYLVQPFFVKGASMEPNFEDGDYLLVDEISYRFNPPQRGDVVVFRSPEDKSQFFIKRIIGLPGETVEIKNNVVVIYNDENPGGLNIPENYLEYRQLTTGDIKYKLGAEEFYVLGDNRMQSADSRRWGPLPRENIIGRVFLRPWPVNKFSKIQEVSY